jgi:hypothetical protein
VAALQIGIDPTTWYFQDADYDAVVAGLAQPDTPLVVDVFSPLVGRLVLNLPAAGSVAVSLPIDPHWNPNGMFFAKSPGLYVASTTGPHKNLPGYTLAPGYKLRALEKDIIGAMTGKATLTIGLEVGNGGVLALSGASLSYAVLCPPKRQRSGS